MANIVDERDVSTQGVSPKMTCQYCMIAIDTTDDVVMMLSEFSQLNKELATFDHKSRYCQNAAEFARRIRDILNNLAETYDQLQEIDARNGQ